MKITTSKIDIFQPIRKQGIDFKSIEGSYLMRTNADNDYMNWITMNSTVILGCNPKEKDIGGCSAEWEFDISQLLKRDLVDAQLRITTFRTTGGLHVNPKELRPAGSKKQGRLYLNGTLVDNIDLVKIMPNGTDYGYNRLDTYPILSLLLHMKANRQTNLIVKVEVDEKVRWDIDEISLESLTYKITDLTNWVWMLLGAIVGTVLGLITQFLI